MKTKQRFKQVRVLQPMKVDLKSVTNDELFEELMNRIVRTDPCVCYFIDRNFGKDWNIHRANGNPIIEIGRNE